MDVHSFIVICDARQSPNYPEVPVQVRCCESGRGPSVRPSGDT
jgi:hypothetical protein